MNGRCGLYDFDRLVNHDLLNTLAHLDDLRCARLGVCFDAATLRPGIGVIVVSDIADQKAVLGLVDDQANVTIDPHRPEIGVLRLVDAVELKPRRGGVHLRRHL